MASGSQGLVLRFNTDLGAAQRNISKFVETAAGDLRKISGAAMKTKTALEFLGNHSKEIAIGASIAASAIAAVAAFELFSAAVYNAREALDGLNKIGTQARAAGVGTTFFQSWTQQAKELNHETSDMVAMLEHARKAMTDTIGENGEGPKNTTRDRIRQNILAGNLSDEALTSFNAADTQEARFRVILGLIDQLKEKSTQLAAFDLGKVAFGATFESDLRNGVDAVGKMRAALDGLQSAGGARIVPKEEIENAQRMQAELDAINDKLAKGMKPIVDDIARIQQGSLESLIQAKGLWADLVVEAGRYYSEIKDHIQELGEGFGLLSQKQLPRPQGHPGEDQAPAITVHGDKSKPLPSLTPKTPAAVTPTDQVDTYIKSLQKLTAAEEAEAQTLGLGNKAKQEAVDLAKAQQAAAERGTPLTAKETEQVKQLADSYVAAKDKIEAYNKAQEQAKATGEFFGQTLEGAIEKLALDGGKLKDVLLDVVKALEQAALKAILLGEGPLANLLGGAAASGATGTAAIGGILGQLINAFPHFAEGGDLPAGQFGIAGENGPEIIQGPATVTPYKHINAALNSGGARAGGHAIAMTIDVRGAQGNSEIQTMITNGVRAGMNEVHNKIARDIGPMTARWNRRYG